MKTSLTTLSNILAKLDPVRNGRDISNKALFKAFNRNPDRKTDAGYIDNKVSELKGAGAVTVYHTDVFPRRRTHITLTDKGMDILEGRATQTDQNSAGQTAAKPPDKPDKTMSLQEITDLIKEWNRQNHDWHIDPRPEYIGEEVPSR